MSRKQSLTDRTKRFVEGRCPIHGVFMGQIDGWYYPEDSEPYTMVGCPRGDCNVQAMAGGYNGPWQIMPHCAYVLDEVLPSSVLEKSSRPKNASQIAKPKREAIWAKTDGRCYYCGQQLKLNSTYTVDHIISKSRGGLDVLENMVPSCRNCNSTKGVKNVDEFRFLRVMQKFEQQNGVTFTAAQVAFLSGIDVELNIPSHTFWFEQL